MTALLPRSASVLRGFAVDFLTGHDSSAVQWVMDPGYRLSIGGFMLDGRDTTYLPATSAQLDQFPGLCVTAHDVVIGPDAVALRFTEHGASVRDDGRIAAWRGITLFRIAGGRLAEGWAEEDYLARKRQLKSGLPDPVAPPHLAPWDAPCLAPDAASEAAVRAWLATPANVVDSGRIEWVMVGGPAIATLIWPERLVISTLFTAGDRAAFHIACHGRYAAGFPDIDPALVGESVILRMAAIADVAAGDVVRVQMSVDRLGLHRQLQAMMRTRGSD